MKIFNQWWKNHLLLLASLCSEAQKEKDISSLSELDNQQQTGSKKNNKLVQIPDINHWYNCENCLYFYLMQTYLTLGQAECMAEMQPAIHVGVRKGDKVLVFAVEKDNNTFVSLQWN